MVRAPARKGRPVIALDYDRLAAEYAVHRTIHPEVFRSLVHKGNLTARSVVLDVGCGTGNYLAAMARTVGCACRGVEPSASMRAIALVRVPGAAVKEGSAERLDFDDDSFDLVFSVDAIHHFSDRMEYFREAFRVIRPDGFVCTVTDSEEVIRHRVPLSTHFPETVRVELDRYPRMADLGDLMVAAGFAGLREETVEFRYSLTDIGAYRDKAYSSLHLISAEAFGRGIGRMEADLARDGSIPCSSRYTILWGGKPA